MVNSPLSDARRQLIERLGANAAVADALDLDISKGIQRVIKKLGGPAFVARALGHKNRTTVSSWISRPEREGARIPIPQQILLIELGQKVGIQIDPDKFLEGATKKRRKKKGTNARREQALAP